MARDRRWYGWGFEDEALPPGRRVLALLESRLGAGVPLPPVAEAEVSLPPPLPLAEAPLAVRTDRETRLRHARGQSFPDVVALRRGALTGAPDGVVRPADAGAVVELIRWASAAGVSLVPRGGGTSVVGGVSVRSGTGPTVVVSLDELCGLLDVDPVSHLARFAAGTYGPAVERALAPHGLQLGHEPQSFELSTVGGWVATRSAGQRSAGVGKIEDLVAGVEIATAAGLWRLPPQPASAAGPELRRLVVGSEGRLGIITSATLRVRSVPAAERGVTVHLPSWEDGIACCRELLQTGNPVEVVRLSDPAETSFALTLLDLPRVVRAVARPLARMERFSGGCMLLLGWTGSAPEVRAAERNAAETWRRHGGLAVGTAGWRHWKRDRFRHPYLRDALLDVGYGVDTLETAVPWHGVTALYRSVRAALTTAADRGGFPTEVLCHLSHPYRDGSSLYFTFFWPLGVAGGLERWLGLKEAATEALLDAGGTLTHHHGVGTMHAAHLRTEIGETGLALLRAAATRCDPAGVMNPGVLIGDGEG